MDKLSGLWDIIGRFLDIRRIPFQTPLFLLLCSVCFLFAPVSWAAYAGLDLDAARRSGGPVAVAVLVASVALLLTKLLASGWDLAATIILDVITKRSIARAVKHLDPEEKALIREFKLLQRNTLQLPIDQPVVSGLLTNGILRRVGNYGAMRVAGMAFPVALSPAAEQLISLADLDLPSDGILTPELEQQLRDSRPGFIRNP